MPPISQEVEESLHQAREGQRDWQEVFIRRRLKMLRAMPSKLCDRASELVEAVYRPNSSAADVLASEILPLADACRFAAKRGRQILAPETHSWRNAAFWMGRIRVRTLREPWGVVLVLAPSNYPLFLPGVQVVQALAAGNAVAVKPAPHGTQAIEELKSCLVQCDVPSELIQILPESIEAGQSAMAAGVDHVLLTGSVETGRQVLKMASETVTPTTLELSGCDSVFISPQADLQRAAKCMSYALTLNGGATCIAPRRVFVSQDDASGFAKLMIERTEERLKDAAADGFSVPAQVVRALRRHVKDALAGEARIIFGQLPDEPEDGQATCKMRPLVLDNVSPNMAVVQSDLFAPITSLLSVGDMSGAMRADEECPYSLAASIFAPQAYADHWATQINAGCVVINDIVVPTADPRVSFGGRGKSGWGVTRGPQGLLDMTRPKVICSRRGKWLPHLDPVAPNQAELLKTLMQVMHRSSWLDKFSAMRKLIQLGRKSSEGS